MLCQNRRDGDTLMQNSEHTEIIKESFTAQAEAFAAQPWIAEQDRIARLVAAANLKGTERVLDVATGPGYIAEGFAKKATEAIGVDVTDAMLAIARARTASRGIKNVSFRAADARHLPFGDGEFDVTVCRLALHHMPDPLEALREMTRVCRRGGMVLVQDIIASEHPERAAYQDRFEILRDPSHVRTLPLSELLRLFQRAGLEVDSVETADDLRPEAEPWMATTNTPPEKAAEIRRLLAADLELDLSGTGPYLNETGSLCFHERTATVAGRKFRG